jgi:hypothetical protein
MWYIWFPELYEGKKNNNLFQLIRNTKITQLVLAAKQCHPLLGCTTRETGVPEEKLQAVRVNLESFLSHTTIAKL